MVIVITALMWISAVLMVKRYSWKVVKKQNKGTLPKEGQEELKLCVRISFSALQGECGNGKTANVIQPSGKLVKTVGDSLCKNLGGRVKID